jgi:hypothetical protein
MNRTVRVAIALVLALVAALGIYVWRTFDIVTVQQPPQWGPEAKANGYLAAGQLLRRRGYHVEFWSAYRGVPPGPGVLLLADADNGLSETDVGELRQWVKTGNSVLACAQPRGPEHVPDFLLDPLGVQVKTVDPGTATPPPPVPEALHTPDGDLQTVFSASLESLPNAPQAGLADRDGLHVLDFPLGRGHITAFSDTTPFGNHHIGEADNAALLLYLMPELSPKATVWIVFQGQYPSFTHLIWQHAWPLVLSLGLFLLVWLGWSSRRFGPLLPAITAPRRQLGEHLRACGRYLWHAGQQARLYKALRGSLRRRMLRRHPQWRQLSNNELLVVLASHSGLEPAALRRALVEQPTRDLARFLGDVRVMNHLRKQL